MKTEDERPDPDKLLTLVKESQVKTNKGKLKLFLGMAAGVGKTYAMLNAAHRLKSQGIETVVGWVDTHGRAETEALLHELMVFPRKKVAYKGAELDEMDLDGLLVRKPKLVIVDELAHSNAPGSRNTKRYLDVLELLEAGIDVFSALNIQHLESRVDTVREITGVQIFETVPDSILDIAHEIVLIDLPPEELIKRLKEGRIYPKERIDTAAAHFFKVENLSALREMALRSAAEKVDKGLRDYKSLQGIERAWKSADRLLVGVFASPYSEVLIRWTRRMADVFNSTWVGAYVETGHALSVEEQAFLAKNIALVKELGGELVSTKDEDAVRGILRLARKNNVTQIFVGKSKRAFLFQLFNRGSVVGRLIRESGDIDVSVVSSAEEKPKFKVRQVIDPVASKSSQVGIALATVLATWAVAGALSIVTGYLAIGIVFLVVVCISAIFFSRSIVILMATLFAFVHNFFFIPPLYHLTISRLEDGLMLAMYFAAAIIIGNQTSRIAKRERLLREQEAKTQLLLSLSKDLATAASKFEIYEKLLVRLSDALGIPCCAYFLEGEKRVLHPTSAPERWSEADGVVAWVIAHGRDAGKGTGTLSSSNFLFIPIRSDEITFGAIGLKVTANLSIESRSLVDAMLHQASSSLEREHYQAESQKASLLEQTQRLYHTLLDCVSHELRTPISSIKGAVTALCDNETTKNKKVLPILQEELLTALRRLERVVENLLDMTRIESGMLKPKQKVFEVADILGTVTRDLDDEERLKSDLKIKVSEGTPALMGDLVLTEQALAKVINNAFQYSLKGTPIEVSIGPSSTDNFVEFKVRDHGPGLDSQNSEIVFQKFYRARPKIAGGLGLGLTIAKGFIEAQGGKISAANSEGGGAEFAILLPGAKVQT